MLSGFELYPRWVPVACGRDPMDDVWLSDPALVEDWTLDFL